MLLKGILLVILPYIVAKYLNINIETLSVRISIEEFVKILFDIILFTEELKLCLKNFNFKNSSLHITESNEYLKIRFELKANLYYL